MEYEHEENGFKYNIPKPFHFGKIVFKPINAQTSELNFDGLDDSEIMELMDTTLKTVHPASFKRGEHKYDPSKFNTELFRMLSKLSSKERVEYLHTCCKKNKLFVYSHLTMSAMLGFVYDEYFTFLDIRQKELLDERSEFIDEMEEFKK